MHTINSHRTVYVAGVTASILTCYLDQQSLALPDIREKLSRLASAPRMPITTWWSVLEEIQLAHPIAGLGLAIGRCTQPHVGLPRHVL